MSKGKYTDKGIYIAESSASGGAGSGSAISLADENSVYYFPSGFAYNTGVSSIQLTPAARVFIYRNWVPFQMKIDSFKFRVSTAGAGSTIYAGVYDNVGTSLLFSGSTSGATIGEKTVTLGADYTLAGGFYIVAFGATTTGALPYVQAHSTVSTNIMDGLNNATAAGFTGYGANTITGGALPGSIGAITTANGQRLPWMILSGSA